MRAVLWDGLTLWILQKIPLQIFFLLLFISPDAFLVTSPFPALYHGAIYYWTIYRPESFSFPLLFIASLFFDTLVGYHLGYTFLEIMCLFFGVLYQRKNLTHAPFLVVWVCFIFCIAFFVLGAVLVRLVNGQPFLYGDLLYSFLWVVISYPLLNWGFAKINGFLDQFYVRN